MYSVRPLGSVRTSPSAVFDTFTAAAADDVLDDEEDEDDEEDVVDDDPPPALSLEPPPHAASTATAEPATSILRPRHRAMTPPSQSAALTSLIRGRAASGSLRTEMLLRRPVAAWNRSCRGALARTGGGACRSEREGPLRGARHPGPGPDPPPWNGG